MTTTHARDGDFPVYRLSRPHRALGIRELWAHRELMLFFVWRDLKVRYKQTIAGALWAALQPVSITVVFSIFFGRLAKLPSNGLPYPVFFLSGLVPWTYFAASVSGATDAVVRNSGVVTKVYFPRLVLPVAAVLSPLLDFAIAMAVLGGLLAIYGVAPVTTAFLIPAYLLLAVASAVAVGLWFAALSAEYRDVRHAAPLVIQFWLFASPVAYPSTLVPASWRWAYNLNPMATVVEGFRWALTGRGLPPGPTTAASVVAVAVLLFGGLLYFRRSESKMVDFA